MVGRESSGVYFRVLTATFRHNASTWPPQVCTTRFWAIECLVSFILFISYYSLAAFIEAAWKETALDLESENLGSNSDSAIYYLY